jgi:hypothetical protein
MNPIDKTAPSQTESISLLLFTGLYLFVLPYAAKWHNGRRTDSSPAVDTR